MKNSYVKSEFELLKQILQDLGNLNSTLALMNINKFFPSKTVSESTDRFFRERREFVGKGDAVHATGDEPGNITDKAIKERRGI